ncbi:ABC transporter permease [Streptomyces sp. NPDC054796]
MAARCVRLSTRNPDAAVVSLLLPVLLMLVFVYFFGGAIRSGTSTYVTYVAPGVLILCAGYGASMTAVSVSRDMTEGIIDRFRSMDVGGFAVLSGHVAASLARNAAATAAVLGVAFAIGFRPRADALEWAAAVGILAVYVVTLSWLAAAVGLLARSPEAASGFTFFILFLPYPSSAFVPVGTMPSWLHGFAEHQPVTPVIESLRALLLAGPTGTAPWQALAWCAGLLALAVPLSRLFFRIRTA